MADQEKKAFQLKAEAEKKMKSTGFLGSLFGGSNRQEDAAELYIKAANAFKMAKNWNEAAQSFIEAAKIHIKLQTNHEAATNYLDAGNCFRKTNPQEAVNCLLKACEIYTDMGRFTMAAKHHMSIAEIYESELVDVDKAIANYQQAADYYKGEESNSAANKCLLKVAHFAAEQQKYDKAIDIFEEVASGSIENALLKYSAKEYFFKAALCHLCVDLLNAQQALERYEGMFPSFGDARECKLLKKVIAAVEEQNADDFTETLREYDSISRLEPWSTTLLLRVKKTIEGGDFGEEEGDGLR